MSRRKKLEIEVGASEGEKVRSISEFVNYLESETKVEKPAFVVWVPTTQTFLDLINRRYSLSFAHKTPSSQTFFELTEKRALLDSYDIERVQKLLEKDKLKIPCISRDFLEKQFSSLGQEIEKGVICQF
jgi:hypothetical protein